MHQSPPPPHPSLENSWISHHYKLPSEKLHLSPLSLCKLAESSKTESVLVSNPGHGIWGTERNKAQHQVIIIHLQSWVKPICLWIQNTIQLTESSLTVHGFPRHVTLRPHPRVNLDCLVQGPVLFSFQMYMYSSYTLALLKLLLETRVF